MHVLRSSVPIVPAAHNPNPDGRLALMTCPGGTITAALLPPRTMVPRAEGVHVLARALSCSCPRGQCWHWCAPKLDALVPGVHGRQVVWPVSFWCVPGSQGVHRVASLSVPARV